MATLLDCRAVPPLLSQQLDGPIPPADWVRLQLHLAGCPACRTLHAQLVFTRRALAHLARPARLRAVTHPVPRVPGCHPHRST